MRLQVCYNVDMTFEEFCGGPLWDNELTWNVSDPEVPLCFQHVILQWIPCVFLFLCLSYEVWNTRRSNFRDIPWSWYNVSKVMIVGLLIGVNFSDLVVITIYRNEEDIPDVKIVTGVVNILAYITVLVINLLHRKHGIRSSGTLFNFWFLKAFFGIVQLRSEVLNSAAYSSVSYCTQYGFICLIFLIEFFPDKEPLSSSYSPSKTANPEIRNSFISRLLFVPYESLIWKGLRKHLTVEDIFDIKPWDSSREMGAAFDKYWTEEVQKARNSNSTASILPVIAKAYGGTFVLSGVIHLVMTALQLTSPFFMMALLSWVSSGGPLWQGFLLSFGLFFTTLLHALLNGQYYYNNILTGLHIRTGLIGAIYRKLLRIPCVTTQADTSTGHIVNLMAVDAHRFLELVTYLHGIWSGPLLIVICMWLLYQILGVAMFAGVAVMVLMAPVSNHIAGRLKKLQADQMKHKDERIRKMNEILSGIRVLKLYAWEPSFQSAVADVRDKELKVLKWNAVYGAAMYSMFTTAPFLITLVSFAVFVLIDENNVLDPQTAFVSLALFNILKEPVGWLTTVITLMLQTGVGMKRINKFMNSEELDPDAVTHQKSEDALHIVDGTFKWSGESPTLKNIDFRVQKGQLAAVVGVVGSGKSSLLSALLGEMKKLEGSVNIDGTVVYVSQQAWIQNATLRDNVLFGKEMDQERYNRVIESCALWEDLKVLPAGDLTEIGEKGINLSGGQKQRVALARAVYANADIYLLDDPLSAVDVHVGEHIFEKVLGSRGMLVGKTRLLVTNSPSLLPLVDEIIVMKNGRISETGSFQNLTNSKGTLTKLLAERIQLSKPQTSKDLSNSKENVEVDDTNDVSKHPKTVTPGIISMEETATGAVTRSVYCKYLKAVGISSTLWVLCFSTLAQAGGIFYSLSLTKWTEDPDAAVDTSTRDAYLITVTIFGFLQSLFVFIATLIQVLGCLNAAKTLHNSLLDTILHLPMSFFESTPLGRVLNRFSKDVDTMDIIIPSTLRAWIVMIFAVLGVLTVIGISTPIFLITIPVLFAMYYFIQRVYIATSRQLKRLESTTRSPIFSHFEETIAGQSTVRAFSAQDRFVQESNDRVDLNLKISYPSLVMNRWVALRLEIVGVFVVLFAAVFAVLAKDSIGPGMVGLSISYALQISATLSYMVRMTAELETNIVAVERLEEYIEAPKEAEWQKGTVGVSWPDRGEIEFKGYEIRYRDGLDLVIKGISLKIGSKEKIGIVGRTGAGKSSLTLGLLRIVEPSGGRILIDGVDIASIGLHQVRGRLTIIPQDPTLFAGSLRKNLDPFKVHSDEELWKALEVSQLKSYVSGLPEGIDHELTENGQNLSVGQRQLICLARAILRKTKILILDEATAAIDLETDQVVQQTIRTEFADCTVLTVAHRLNTIIDYDKILVLENGSVVEFDQRKVLLENKNSVFYGMVRPAGLLK